jgi:hypothetical protein
MRRLIPIDPLPGGAGGGFMVKKQNAKDKSIRI